jgi:hypothetical protein
MSERLRVWLVLIVPILAVIAVIAGMRYGAAKPIVFANIHASSPPVGATELPLWVETVTDEDGELQRRALNALTLDADMCGKTTRVPFDSDELGAALLSTALLPGCAQIAFRVRSREEVLLDGAVSYPLPTQDVLPLDMTLAGTRVVGELEVLLPTVRIPVDALAPLWVRVRRGGKPAAGATVRILDEPALGSAAEGGRVHQAKTCDNGLALLAVHPTFGIAPLTVEAIALDGTKSEFFGPLRMQPGAIALQQDGNRLVMQRPTRDGVTALMFTDARATVKTLAYSGLQQLPLLPPSDSPFVYASTLPGFYSRDEQAWLRWPYRSAAWSCDEAARLLAAPAYAPTPPRLLLSGKGNRLHDVTARRRFGFTFAFAGLALGALAEIVLLMLGARRTQRLLQGVPALAHEDKRLELMTAVLVLVLLFALLAGYITMRVRGG